jgi:hypothetical protein
VKENAEKRKSVKDKIKGKLEGLRKTIYNVQKEGKLGQTIKKYRHAVEK